jgi:hypothetical protein
MSSRSKSQETYVLHLKGGGRIRATLEENLCHVPKGWKVALYNATESGEGLLTPSLAAYSSLVKRETTCDLGTHMQGEILEEEPKGI